MAHLERYRRSFWNGKKEPVCKLNCDCTPDFQAHINQAGTVEQASKQEQVNSKFHYYFLSYNII